MLYSQCSQDLGLARSTVRRCTRATYYRLCSGVGPWWLEVVLERRIVRAEVDNSGQYHSRASLFGLAPQLICLLPHPRAVSRTCPGRLYHSLPVHLRSVSIPVLLNTSPSTICFPGPGGPSETAAIGSKYLKAASSPAYRHKHSNDVLQAGVS